MGGIVLQFWPIPEGRPFYVYNHYILMTWRGQYYDVFKCVEKLVREAADASS